MGRFEARGQTGFVSEWRVNWKRNRSTTSLDVEIDTLRIGTVGTLEKIRVH